MVKRCFGTSGQKDCLMNLCPDSNECYKCYLKYYSNYKKGFNIRLREVIADFMKENNLRYK